MRPKAHIQITSGPRLIKSCERLNAYAKTGGVFDILLLRTEKLPLFNYSGPEALQGGRRCLFLIEASFSNPES